MLFFRHFLACHGEINVFYALSHNLSGNKQVQSCAFLTPLSDWPILSKRAEVSNRTIVSHVNTQLNSKFMPDTIFVAKTAERKVTQKLNTWGCSRVSWFDKLANKLFTHRWKSPGKVTSQLPHDLPANLPTNPLPTSYPSLEVSSLRR